MGTEVRAVAKGEVIHQTATQTVYADTSYGNYGFALRLEQHWGEAEVKLVEAQTYWFLKGLDSRGNSFELGDTKEDLRELAKGILMAIGE